MKFVKSLKLFVFSGTTMVTLATQAVVLTGVPMQGGMAMPAVSYHANDGMIHVIMPTNSTTLAPEVPTLTPLLISNPNDCFDPLDPWFTALNPSAQGASFSRRYGFVMDSVNVSDPLPAGTQMWIRKLSGPPELKFYRYNGSEPKAFTPIFGTEGTTNALYWNAMMFHPTVTAPPGTNELTATFEVYLHDTVSGQDVPGSSSGPLVFDWTNLSDGRPTLNLAPKIFVAWPSDATTNWVLESATTPNATSWTTVTNTPAMVDGKPGAVLNPAEAQQYFRMRYIP